MPQNHKPDPYCYFKDDRERRRALNFRVAGIVMVALAMIGAGWPGNLSWLIYLLR